MKEKIYNDYHIIINEIIKINDGLFVLKTVNGEYYYQKLTFSDLNVSRAYQISSLLEKNSQIKSNRLIATIDNRIINNGYCMFKKANYQNDVDIDDIIQFSNKKYYINNHKIDWSLKWEKIIDNVEQIIKKNSISDPELLIIINLFIGLGENAILLYRQSIEKIKQELVPSHVHMSTDPLFIYNPLSYDWDYEERDLSEYVKSRLFESNCRIEDIEYIKAIKKWNKYEWTVFFSNLLFCDDFFLELIDNINNNMLNEIKKNYLIINSYMNNIKKINKSLNLFIPEILWLNS